MSRLTCHSAGESHGRCMIALVEGFPAGFSIDESPINRELARRQGGYGRGGRQQIEHDSVAVLSGVLRGRSIGSPVALMIENRDFRIDQTPAISKPRPGHADFAGAMKWSTADCRPVIERASARETAARVAAGAMARGLLAEFGIDVTAYVTAIGGVAARVDPGMTPDALIALRDASEVYCPDAAASAAMVEAIRAAKLGKDTLGGVVEVRVRGCPPGLGSCMRWQDKLDGRLMRAVGSVQAIKGVEIGLGFEAARRSGSNVHDPMDFDSAARGGAELGFTRRTNHAGGIEGGMTNGMPIVLRAAMKPISTLLRGIDSVDLATGVAARSDYERSDICAVPAASVVIENVVAFEVADAFLDKFAGDTRDEVRGAYDRYLDLARGLTQP